MPSTAARPAVAVHRVEVRPKPNAGDPRADELMEKARGLGLKPESVRTARVYLIEGPFDDAEIRRVVDALLANPVTEEAVVGAAEPHGALVEIHPLPGVMDPPAQTVRDAIEELTGVGCRVLTGWRYDLRGISLEQAADLASRALANPVVTGVHTEAFHPAELPKGHAYELSVRHVEIRNLDDAALEKLSREAHLFLSLEEMRAIRDEYRRLDREPTDIELETLAQTWSEHCVHKTLKATIRYESDDPDDPVMRPGRPGHEANPDGSVTIHNLLKSSVAAATFELIEEGLDWTRSVFVDNAGIIAFDDDHAVCIKVETHNHPSAIEPYGGAATGIGGCIRDIMGTGLAAKPIANTDVFCVAMPDIQDRVFVPDDSDFKHSACCRAIVDLLDDQHVYTARLGQAAKDGWRELLVYRGERQSDGHKEFEYSPIPANEWYSRVRDRMTDRENTQGGNWNFVHRVEPGVPAGCLPPDRVLREVVAGVRDYGNRMGIPTVNGAVWFDDRHIGNPLVLAGCIGVMPNDRIQGEAKPGDLIVALGGRTGRDGIHGATFSSAELTDTHADEFAHAVQIGNAIEEKRVLDAILRARDGETERRRDGVEDLNERSVRERLTEMGHSDFVLFGWEHLNPGGFRAVVGVDSGTLLAVDPVGRVPPEEVTEYARMLSDRYPLINRFLSGESTSSLRLSVSSSPLYSAITDCGAGGFSSAVGEMGEKLGAEVHLENAPLKYDGLSYTEIWISEAQERMVLAVPKENLAALQAICDEEHVELSVLGTFGTENRDLILTYHGTEVGRLPMEFLHDGIPMPTREALWSGPRDGETKRRRDEVKASDAATIDSSTPSLRLSVSSSLLALLAHPNIASKHWIINQYDHEVQGNTVVKPLVGPLGRGPSDAAVIEPIPGSGRGLAVACGLATGLESDPYHMALAAIDECVRNLVCTGADPDRIAILDNFCWPSCKKPENLGSLVRAAEGCYDGAKAYRTPFVSGKDSLNNQFTTEDGKTIEIPPTLLITGIGLVHDLARVVTMDAKKPGNRLVLVGTCDNGLGGSHYQRLFGTPDGGDPNPPPVDLGRGPKAARAVHGLIRHGLVRSAHDVSDGGMVTAIAEMLIAGSTKDAPLGFAFGTAPDELWSPGAGFAECPSCYIVEIEVDPDAADPYAEFHKIVGEEVGWTDLGELTGDGRLTISASESVEVERLAEAWRSPLDW